MRRATGPWTPAVRALLAYLASAGFAGAPRLIDSGGERREVLQYVVGETVGDQVPFPAWCWADPTLVQVARLLRRYHVVVSGFRPTEPMAWHSAEAAVGPAEVVCHNDVSPATVVRRDGEVAALLDWDMAVPAPPEWDLAHAAWQFVPLHPPGLAARL
ncbi:MAG: phosphotransferase, partial [Actinomycetes bacterium]